MLTAAQVAEFKRQGFLLGAKVLTDEQVEELRAELARVIADTSGRPPQPVLKRNLSGKDDAPVIQIVNIWEASPAYARLIRLPVVTGEVAQLIGARELRVWHDQIQYKPAETGGVNMWHQDSPLWPILRPQTQVTAWFALDDVDPDNGCMSMVPGSHQWGSQLPFLHEISEFGGMPEKFEQHRLKVVLRPVRKGHVHYHHGLVWHGSHANGSGRPRRAIAVHYMGDDTCYNAAGNHVMKQFVTVPDGSQLTGEHFPRVWPT